MTGAPGKKQRDGHEHDGAMSLSGGIVLVFASIMYATSGDLKVFSAIATLVAFAVFARYTALERRQNGDDKS